ncbi:MAG: ABC transporter ATP-binding protein [Acidimicrobiia bacterium]
METSYECRDLHAEVASREGRRRVLADISFDVGKGEFVSIMGRSGVGKTTLLRVLAGLLEPSPGSIVRLDGNQITGPPEGVSLVFQDYTNSLLPWRSVARNVGLPLEGHVTAVERQERVAEALRMVGLDRRGEDHPFELSGGMQQRVQLARALVSRPGVLLMDEPFGALDALTKSELEDQLLEVFSVTGTTVIFVTHDIDEAVYLSDRLLVLEGDPATIGAEITVDCPRPRSQLPTRESAAFLAARHRVHEVFFGTG